MNTCKNCGKPVRRINTGEWIDTQGNTRCAMTGGQHEIAEDC